MDWTGLDWFGLMESVYLNWIYISKSPLSAEGLRLITLLASSSLSAPCLVQGQQAENQQTLWLYLLAPEAKQRLAEIFYHLRTLLPLKHTAAWCNGYFT